MQACGGFLRCGNKQALVWGEERDVRDVRDAGGEAEGVFRRGFKLGVVFRLMLGPPKLSRVCWFRTVLKGKDLCDVRSLVFQKGFQKELEWLNFEVQIFIDFQSLICFYGLFTKNLKNLPLKKGPFWGGFSYLLLLRKKP